MKWLTTLLILIIGMAGGAVALSLYQQQHMHQASDNMEQEQKPLYWVAPMDPNYRRDQPGKSPMGMDLIPVYAESSNGTKNSDGPDEGPGTISISPDVENNLGVRTTIARQRTLQPAINTVGYIDYDETLLTHIHPRVEGWIEKLYVKASGDPITQGQPLYELYSPQLVNAQEELLLAIKRNNAHLIQATEDRLRALNLSSSFIRALKKDGKVRQRVTFRAAHSGVVDNLNIREGFFVKPGTTMMSIGVLDQVWVNVEVFERQATWLETDLPVTMTLGYVPGRQWQGRVDYIYPILDANTRTVRARLRFNNPDLMLKPNMFAEVVIHPQPHVAPVSVPSEAVIRTGSQDRIVLALGEGKYKSVAVKLGRSDKKHTEILRGILPNEQVVTSAQFLLDSESSKTSDFRRLHHGLDSSDLPQATVDGVIEAIDITNRNMTIHRKAIAKWNRPATTMDFALDDDVAIERWSIGNQVRFHFVITDDAFLITEMEALPAEEQP